MKQKITKSKAHNRARKAEVSKKRAAPLRVPPPKVRETSRSARSTTPAPMRDAWDYGLDAWQRSILFLDTLRRRADDMLAHERAGKPPLLDFDYEMLVDARHFAWPANYALLRITRVGDDCLADCVNENKPPVIIVDPRAGHGPAGDALGTYVLKS